MGPLHRAHAAYCTASPKLASVDHQCHSSRVWVYLHCAVEKDTSRAAGQDTAFTSSSEIHAPRADASPAASRFRKNTSFGTELALDLSEGHRFKCLKWSQVLQKLLLWEILYPASLLETVRNVLSSTLDRVCWQRFSATLPQLRQDHSPKAKDLKQGNRE